MKKNTAAAGAIEDSPRFVDNYLAYLLAQASHRISAEFHRQANEAGISVTEWRVLASLEGSPGETIGSLAALALTKQPTLSKVVQRLEADGLVVRAGVRSDRRQTRVRITPKGHALVGSLCSAALEHQDAVLRPFGHERAAQLMEMLRALMGTPLEPAEDEEA